MKNNNLISRREFIGGLVLATTMGPLLASCSRPSWKLGCYTRAWGNRHYLIALDGMVEAGYKYVGLSTHDNGRVIDRETLPEVAIQVGEEIKKRGLKLATLSGGGFDLKESIDGGIVQLKQLIDNAAYCGAPIIQINDVPDPDLAEKFYKVISESCDYAAEKGVMITVKPHGSTGAVCRSFVDKVGNKNFKLWYDPGNVCFYTEGKVNPVDDADKLDGVVVGMAVKDFRLPKNVSITPGTGMVDFPNLIKRLRKGGFKNGPLIVECLNDGDLSYVNAEARKTREFLEEITSNL